MNLEKAYDYHKKQFWNMKTKYPINFKYINNNKKLSSINILNNLKYLLRFLDIDLTNTLLI